MKKVDYSVSVLRILATLFIVLCHLFSFFGYSALAQFFNVGVPIFFLISGYLYGEKSIPNIGEFLFKRYLRLEIPAMIWLGIMCVSALIRNIEMPVLHECVFLLLNLQGLNFVFSRIQDLFIGPWFFTNIMLCYILFVLFLRIEHKHPEIDKVLTIWGGALPLTIFALLGLIHVNIGGALCFFMGVALKRRHLLERIKHNSIIIYLLVFVTTIALRLLTKRWIDGTVYYDEIMVPLTHAVLAAILLASVKWLFVIVPALEQIASSKLIRHLDRISIYTYICHDMLFSGVVLSIFEWPLPIYVLLPVYFILVIFFATALCFFGEFITIQIEKAKIWLIG